MAYWKDGVYKERERLIALKTHILAIIERRDDPAVKLREIKEILERVKNEEKEK